MDNAQLLAAIRKLPQVEALVADQLRAEDEKAAVGRAGLIDQITACELDVAKLSEAEETQRKAMEAASAEYVKQRGKLGHLASQRGALQSRHHQLCTRLRSEFAEGEVEHAITRLTNHHRDLLQRLEVAEFHCKPKRGMAGLYNLPPDENAQAVVDELRAHVKVAAQAIKSSCKLRLAKLSPAELRQQIAGILASVGLDED